MKRKLSIIIFFLICFCGILDLVACDNGNTESNAKPQMLSQEEFNQIKAETLAYMDDGSKYFCIEAVTINTETQEQDISKVEYCGKITAHREPEGTVYRSSDDPSKRYVKTNDGEWKYYVDTASSWIVLPSIFIAPHVSTADILFPFCAPSGDKYAIDPKYYEDSADPFEDVIAKYYEGDEEILKILQEAKQQKINFSSYSFAVANGKLVNFEIHSENYVIRQTIDFDETKTLTLPDLSECIIMYGTSIALPIDVSLNYPVSASGNSTVVYYRFSALENGAYKVITSDIQSVNVFLSRQSSPIEPNTTIQLNADDTIYVAIHTFDNYTFSFEIVSAENDEVSIKMY